jgi:hypothetical protein
MSLYTSAMRRILRIYMLLAVLLMQTMVWLSPPAIDAQAEQFAHMTVHVQDIDHHHEDDSLHLSADSDSDNNAPHFHADDGVHPIGLTALFDGSSFAAMPSAPPPAFISEPPVVFLDGLLRPPSLTA